MNPVAQSIILFDKQYDECFLKILYNVLQLRIRIQRYQMCTFMELSMTTVSSDYPSLNINFI